MKRVMVMFMMFLLMAPTAGFANGGEDYKAKCAACHGAKGNLLPKTARLLKVDPRKLYLKASTMSKEEMIAVTEKGRGRMPAFEKELTKEQIASIIDYVMSLKQEQGGKNK